MFMRNETSATVMSEGAALRHSIHLNLPLSCLTVLLLQLGAQGCGSPPALSEPEEISDQRLAFGLKDLIPLANGIDSATRRMEVYDVNRDGRQDLLIPDNSSVVLGIDGTPDKNQSLLVLYGQNSGWPALPRALPNLQPMTAVYAARLYSDSRISLLQTPRGTSSPEAFNKLYLLLGAQDGGFSRRTLFVAAEYMTETAVADLDGDGLDDLGALIPMSGRVSLYRGTGGGEFGSRRDINVGTQPSHLSITDLNGDGRMDLVVQAQGSGPASYVVNALLGTAAGYQTPVSSPVLGKPLGGMAADLNKDGIVDLVVPLRPDDRLPKRDVLAVFGGDKSGAFKEFARLAAPEVVVPSLHAEDLDADGNVDLIFATGEYVSQLQVCLGNGDGSFKPPQPIVVLPVPVRISMLRAVDHDGDGRTDLDVVLQYDDPKYVRTLAVLRNISIGRRDAKE